MKTNRLLSFALILAAGITFTLLTSLINNAGFLTKSKYSERNYSQNCASLNNLLINNQNPISEDKKGGSKSGNKVKKSRSITMNWIEMGPSNVGGRTRAVLIDKDNSNLVFAGSVAGGIWKSTTGGLSWVKVNGGDLFDNICIASICQASNGDIYVGTGEYFGAYNHLGFRGQGIWKSTDRGSTWTHLISTWNDYNSKQTFCYVNKLAAHPTDSNKIYAATAKGLMLSTDGGVFWSNPITDANADAVCTDVQVSKDGQVVVSSLNQMAYICNTGDDVFINKSGIDNVLPVDTIQIDVKRIEFAIAPSNSNYIYCLAADNTGALKNVYQSKDKGNTWTAMLTNLTSQFTPFGPDKLGGYENVIAVYPDDYEHIIFGGYNLFEWSPAYPWEQLTANQFDLYGDIITPIYVHSGIHTIVFAPNYSSTNPVIYAGTDGGVFSSIYGGYAWSQINKNYNTTLYNSVAFSNNGKVLGGTQNNGTQLITLNGTSVQDAKTLLYDDGGFCEYSMLNPQFIFVTAPFGVLGRSDDGGNNITNSTADIFSPFLLTTNQVGTIPAITQPYVTPIRLWESFYDTNSTQYILSKAGRTLFLGDTIYPVSSCKRTIPHILTSPDMNGKDSLVKGDTIYVKDTYQSVLAIGFKNSVWITRQGLDMSKVPMFWYRISIPTVKKVQNIEFSSDGNHLYFSDFDSITTTSKIYRCSNLINGRDSLTGSFNSDSTVITTQELGTFNQKITGIAVDPQNSNNMILTLGGYEKTYYIYYSNNAATTTSSDTTNNFVSKQGDLPHIPVYSAIINWNNSLEIIIGTESGVYSPDTITNAIPSWTKQSSIPNVPVVQLRQQIHPNGWMAAPVVNDGFDTYITNHGVIYAATAGRGIFRCEDFRGPVNVPEITNDKINVPQIKVYPNPVKDIANISFNINKRSDVKISIYDLSGIVVKTIQLKNQDAGTHNINFTTTVFSTGTYIAGMEANGLKSTTKFIVY